MTTKVTTATGEHYTPTPFSFYMPSLPSLERHIPKTLNPLLLSLILLRLSWFFLAVIPLHTTLVLLSSTFPSLSSFLSLTRLIKGRYRLTWTLPQKLVYPLIGTAVWTVTGTGALPPDFTPESERAIPFLTRVVQWGQGWVWGQDDEVVSVRCEEVELNPVAEVEGWVREEAVDPRGLIRVGVVPCFWLETAQRKGKGKEEEEGEGGEGRGKGRKAKEGEKVILSFVGGGYVAGHPLNGSRCFDLARETGLRVVGVNFRKATNRSNAFPAALQDAIVAYSHLVLDLGYKDIILAGDSAGGGLAMTLLLYLTSTLSSLPPSSRPSNLLLPSGLILYSPWVDLSRSFYHPTIPPELVDDFVNPTQLNAAINGYLGSTIPTLQELEAEKEKEIPCQWGSQNTVFHLRQTHPFLSPALTSSLPTLHSIPRAYASSLSPAPDSLPRFLIFSGGAEYFAPEIRAFVKNLREVFGEEEEEEEREEGEEDWGKRVKKRQVVEFVEEGDELHVYVLVPRWVSPAVERAMKRIRKFVKEL